MKLLVKVDPIEKQRFAPGVVGGAWNFVAMRSGDEFPVQQVEAVPQSVFDLPPGAYVFTGQRMDVNGNPLGPLRSAEFTVPEDGVDIDVAGGLVVTLDA